MEKANITLRPSKQEIELAHKLAAQEDTSITQLFSSFILARSGQSLRKQIPIGPMTRSVTAILKVPEGWEYKRGVEACLEEKTKLNK